MILHCSLCFFFIQCAGTTRSLSHRLGASYDHMLCPRPGPDTPWHPRVRAYPYSLPPSCTGMHPFAEIRESNDSADTAYAPLLAGEIAAETACDRRWGAAILINGRAQGAVGQGEGNHRAVYALGMIVSGLQRLDVRTGHYGFTSSRAAAVESRRSWTKRVPECGHDQHACPRRILKPTRWHAKETGTIANCPRQAPQHTCAATFCSLTGFGDTILRTCSRMPQRVALPAHALQCLPA